MIGMTTALFDWCFHFSDVLKALLKPDGMWHKCDTSIHDSHTVR